MSSNGNMYTVTGQQFTMVQGPSGDYTQGVILTAVTSSGVVINVTLTQAEYGNLDTVKSKLRAAAAQAEAIQNLSE